MQNGVQIALFVNARDHSVTRFHPAGDETVLLATDRIDLDSVLPGFELTVQELFDSLSLD